jgi:hypothetical protein
VRQPKTMTNRVGEWVQVRSKEEILATLDKNGRLDGLPFMPEMFQFCGKKFRIFKSAHKTCDFVYTIRSRSIPDTVHLPIRCDGKSHGGCQHACLLYWKNSWLTPVDGPAGSSQPYSATSNNDVCSEADVHASAESKRDADGPVYMCQGTEVLQFSSPMAWWDVRQYVKDYASGNVDLPSILCGFAFGIFRTLMNSGFKIGRPLRWFYDLFSFVWGPYPRRPGKVPKGQPVPWVDLNLQPGEPVRVKSYDKILQTITSDYKNRGMWFDAEMVPFCDKEFRVRAVIDTFIDEKTGRIKKLKNRCVSLEGPVCLGKYSECRMLCPRSIIPWWREIWLERVSAGEKNSQSSPDKGTPAH